MTIDLPLPVGLVLDRLKHSGYLAFAVGGCVRDSLLGKRPHDWDVCTSARPAEVLTVFLEFRVIETGLQHGTVTVVAEGEAVEVTTFRTDGDYGDHRHPDGVAFTASLEEDLARRDFTVNAMAYHPDIGLIDPFGGRMDLKQGSIRCVGSPDRRFEEDALRILRAMRFASVLGFQIEAETSRAMLERRTLLGYVSAERVQSELVKTLMGAGAEEMLLTYDSIWGEIIPEILPCVGFAQRNPWHQYDVWTHTVKSLAAAPRDLVLRLTMLLHDLGKPCSYTEDEGGTGHFYGHGAVSTQMAGEILRRLKFDNETRETVVRLVECHDATLEANHRTVKRWLNKLGPEGFERFLQVRAADIAAQAEDRAAPRLEKLAVLRRLAGEIVARGQTYQLSQLAINGRDLIALGIPAGRELGAILQELLRLVIDEQIENSREALLEAAVRQNRAQ